MTPSDCPTVLSLERLLSGELRGSAEAALKDHVRGCARCAARLQTMERQAADFSRSSRSAPAKAAFHRADRAWKRNAMLAVSLPLAAAVLAAVSVSPLSNHPAPPATQWAKVHARSAPSWLEPRGGEGPARLRQLSIRGRPVAFGEGALEGAAGDGASQPFVLKHTDVVADVSGFVSSVTVTQQFENPFSEPVEAVYVFPLPDDAAVDEMTLTAGERVIRAQIQKREVARRMYEEAKQSGRRAALLDQERPNIFTQSVANLLPHETVKVTLHYVSKLAFDDGQYTFDFPMTVGPRYIPGAAVAGESQGNGTSPDTTRVLDASRITPPVTRAGRDISVKVRVDAGLPIEGLESVSHRLRLEVPSEHEAVVTLDPTDTIPNKDLVLRWRVTGAEQRAALLTSGGEGGTFALMVAPQSEQTHARAVPKEMVFLIDTSCSMEGPPLDAAKRAMSLAMKSMGPDDTFMLIDFADRASSFHAGALPNTPGNVQRALSYLDSLPASGGTNQLAGIHAALTLPRDERRVREVLLMTDGYIGNEREIFAEELAQLGDARVFAMGVGTSVNHYLLSRMSTLGRGFYQYIRPDEDPVPAVARLVKRLNRPMLTDVTLQWSGTEVFDLEPSKVPDLFDAQPLVVLGRYRNPGHVHLKVTGRRGSEPVELDVDAEIPAQAVPGSGLRQLWARAKIEELDAQQHFGETADAIQQITTLGLEHHLVTAYTSLIAVDDRQVTRAATPKQVAVPTEKPDQTRATDTTVLVPKVPTTGENTEADTDGDGVPDAVDAVDANDSWNGTPPPRHSAPSTPRAPAPPPVADPSVGHEPMGGSPANPYGWTGKGKGRGGGAADDDDFTMAFGGGGDEGGKMGKKEPGLSGAQPGYYDEDKPKKGDVWIPPAPGSAGTGVKETLGQSDILEVILANKGGLARCAAEQQKRVPGLHGKLVMRWVILPSGRVVQVAVVTSEFKGSYMATCLEALLKTMTFPRSKVQGEPVVFPFKF